MSPLVIGSTGSPLPRHSVDVIGRDSELEHVLNISQIRAAGIRILCQVSSYCEAEPFLDFLVVP